MTSDLVCNLVAINYVTSNNHGENNVYLSMYLMHL